MRAQFELDPVLLEILDGIYMDALSYLKSISVSGQKHAGVFLPR